VAAVVLQADEFGRERFEGIQLPPPPMCRVRRTSQTVDRLIVVPQTKSGDAADERLRRSRTASPFGFLILVDLTCEKRVVPGKDFGMVCQQRQCCVRNSISVRNDRGGIF